MSEEEKMAKLELNRFIYGKQLSKDDIVDYLSILFNLIDKQQKLINIFIHNEAVKEGKDFNEIKEKYYECL